ncbi:hypothetical protein NKI96_10890 [Mesorhizobium sp. M0292]|uniref:hypothetical protein n=1 Tax=Mesorhizobium sp. M0292 TaxID=2956929 RepID=UPI0033371DDC
MPNFVMGADASGGFVKIMKNNADDPLTTPNSDTGKFAFNSEQPGSKVGFILDIIVVEPDFVAYPDGGTTFPFPDRFFLPAGTNSYTCEVMIESWHGSGGAKWQRWYYFPSYFANKYGLSYVPMCEGRGVVDYTAKNTFQGPHLDISASQVSGSGQIYSFVTNYRVNEWMKTYATGSDLGQHNRPSFSVQVSNAAGAVASRFLITVYALPAYDTAIPDYSGTPVSGQEVVRIDKGSGGIARVALPGYDVYNSDYKRFLLHEDYIPAKILAAGEVTVAAGATQVITTRFTLPNTTYMDFIVRRTGSTATEKFQFWSPPFIDNANLNQECGFTYVVSGNTVTITSTADFSIVIRYMICANSGAAPTSGGKKILLMGNDGIGDYVQVKRPGSSDVAPNLDDIMVDTRLSYIPLLAEGFLNYNSTDMPDTMSAPRFKGERKRSLVIPNPNGLLLFPKMGNIYTDTSVTSDYSEPFAMWGSHAVGIDAGSNSGKTTGWSTWANIIDETHLDLWSGGNNAYTYIGGASFYNNQIKGVRYYVFGIPPSL